MSLHIIKESNPKISVIILAAGIGKNIKSYGCRSLFPLHNKQTIVENQINNIRGTFNSPDIILVTGFESERLMAKTPNNIIKIENEKFETTNISRSIGIGLRACSTENILIIYGDLVFDMAALCKLPLCSSFLLIDSFGLMKDSSIGCNIDRGNVEHLDYNLENKWAQIAYIKSGKELKILQSVCWNREKDNLFGFEVINEVITKGGHFKEFRDKSIKIIDVDCVKDLEKTRNIT